MCKSGAALTVDLPSYFSDVATHEQLRGDLVGFKEKTFQNYSFRWTGYMSRPGTQFSISGFFSA